MKLLTLLGIRRSGLLLYLAIVLPFITLKPALIQGLVAAGLVLSWIMGKSTYKLHGVIFAFGALASGLISYSEFSTLRGIAPAVTLLTLLALVQSFDLKTIRDFTLFILICQLLLLSQLLEEYSLWYAVYILSVSLYLFLLMARFHKLMDAQEGQGSLVRRKLIRKMFLYSLPLTLGLFILFPRIPIGNIFSMSKREAGATGFTSQLRPGEISKVAQDDSIYFRARIRQDAIAMPLLYWRGGVLAENKGFSWDQGKIIKRADRSYKKDVRFDYKVNLSTLESSPLFHLKGTKRFKNSSPGRRRLDPGGITFFHPFSNHKTKYTAEYTGIQKEWITKKDVQKYLQVDSSVGKKVRALALELKKETPEKTYLEIVKYFQQKKFSYTLSPGIQGLEGFIFENKKGFCEHFASSTAILLRLAKIPTRIVTGFHGGLYNPNGGYYQVRGQDAHAWLEFWTGDKWKRGDPTEYIAPERINFGYEGLVLRDQVPEGMGLRDFIGQRANSTLSRVFFAWDSFYNNLNQKFLEYDYFAQRELFNFAKLRRFTGLILLSICLLLFIVITYWWQKGLKSKPAPLDKAYAHFLKRLKKAGLNKMIGEGALSLERRVPHSWSGHSASVEILQLYREIKYAEKDEKLDLFLTKTKLFRPAKIT